MKMSCLLALVLAAGCAATPAVSGPQGTAANAGIKAVQAGVPFCESGHGGALADGIVAIHPGETICLEMRADGSAMVATRVVDSPIDAATTIVLRSWREGNDVFLTVHNPFPKDIKYRAGMLLPGEARHRKTSSCPVLSRRMSLEHWPHPIDEILMTDFHFAPDGAMCD